MKKLWKVVLSVLACATLSAGAVACGGDDSSQAENPSEIEQIYAQYVVKAEAEGTQPLSYEQWLASIKGEKGADGKSAYQIWLDNGNTGTEEDFLAWLKGDGVIVESLHYQKISGKEEYRVIGLGTVSDLDVVIPATYKGLPVTAIGDHAFWTGLDPQGERNIESVEIPDSVTSIGSSAFSGCDGLTSVEIPDSVTSIGEYAFSGCDSLTYNVKGELKYLGNKNNPYLYLADTTSTSITTCTIDESCRFIGDSAFYNCSSLTSVVIPDTVMSIDGYAFYYCSSLKSVGIPANVTSIGDHAFSHCSSLKSVEIPDSVTSIGDAAFYKCSSLTSVVIPDSVTSIGGSAFRECSSLTSIEIPDGVTSIGNYAFYECSSLTSVVIGNGVTSIGYSAFCWCSSLTSITFNGTKAEWEAIEKESSWNYYVPATEVVCLDGRVAL